MIRSTSDEEADLLIVRGWCYFPGVKGIHLQRNDRIGQQLRDIKIDQIDAVINSVSCAIKSEDWDKQKSEGDEINSLACLKYH